MDEESYPEQTAEPEVYSYQQVYNGFWPVLLLGLSLILILAWEIWVGVATRQSAQKLQEQQVRVVEQSKQVQGGLEKLVRGLVDLSRSDDQAQKLVTKFGIKINQPSLPSSTPAP
jgi:hypothetical protein